MILPTPTQPSLNLHSDLLCSRTRLLIMAEESSLALLNGTPSCHGPQSQMGSHRAVVITLSPFPSSSHTNAPSNLAHSLQVPSSPASSPFSAEVHHWKTPRQAVSLPPLPTAPQIISSTCPSPPLSPPQSKSTHRLSCAFGLSPPRLPWGPYASYSSLCLIPLFHGNVPRKSISIPYFFMVRAGP